MGSEMCIRDRIKSATIKIEGDYVFGWLKKESGIHRLVRISPFDSGARRHTSFASVWVYPVVDENINIEINEKDLRIDTYRSSGAGGTESQDWANMLRRMYLKWSDNKKFKSSLISEHKGEEAGIKSATIKIEGDYVFGWLKKESGIHRLVRISPFDSGSRRHTSFASIWIYPVVDENIKIQILDKDLRIDTYRSSGAGGQHVNTTDSAVRVTHIPSKIVVQCQNERSQHKNKETCMNMLKARLYDYEIKKKEKENQNIESSKSDIGWGHQIRSYVLQPYRLVKDNRTNHESTSPDKVLDGDIDDFLEQSLYQIK